MGLKQYFDLRKRKEQLFSFGATKYHKFNELYFTIGIFVATVLFFLLGYIFESIVLKLVAISTLLFDFQIILVLSSVKTPTVAVVCFNISHAEFLGNLVIYSKNTEQDPLRDCIRVCNPTNLSETRDIYISNSKMNSVIIKGQTLCLIGKFDHDDNNFIQLVDDKPKEQLDYFIQLINGS